MAAPKGNQYAKGHGKGRPKIWDDDAIENEGAALLEWIKGDNGLYLDSFARQRGYSRQRLYEWEKTNKDFADILTHAREWQEEKFLTKGLTREWDATFTKYAMARVCGERWKSSYESSTHDESLKALATAVMNYATAQPQDKGWQKPQ